MHDPAARSLADLRREYGQAALREDRVAADPMAQFSRWFAQACAADLVEPNAMTLATVDERGAPAARVVLLKGFDAWGFVFFTNYDSDKGRHIAIRPDVALCFHWDKLERSVRIAGTAAPVSREESEAYFKTRPHQSRLGALASDQSRAVASRAVLEARLAELAARYPEDGDVEAPCPPRWGGYRVTPHTIEFWQGQRSRLHDRLRYTRGAEGAWVMERLSP